MAQSKSATKALSKIKLYQSVFKSPEGKAVLRDLMSTHFIVGSTYKQGSTNDMLFREGERNVVLRILTLVSRDVKEIQERIEQHENEME